MAKEQKAIDTTTDTGGYILGLLWGSLSLYENGFWFRHRDRWYVETVMGRTHIFSTGIP